MEIAIVADSSLHQVSDSAWARSRRIVLRVYSARVHGDLVVPCGMHGVESYCQVLGLVIAPSQRKADVSPAIPAMQQSRMQRFVVCRLLRVVADYRHVFLRSLDRAARLDGHLDLAIASGHGPNDGLAILQTNMQLLVG